MLNLYLTTRINSPKLYLHTDHLSFVIFKQAVIRNPLLLATVRATVRDKKNSSGPGTFSQFLSRTNGTAPLPVCTLFTERS